MTTSVFGPRVGATEFPVWRRLESGRLQRVLVTGLATFTVFSIVGFALFSTPFGLSISAEWLSNHEILRRIYAVAFPAFAQVHIVLSAAVVLWHVSTRIGWPAYSAFVLIVSITFLVEWIGTSTGWPFGAYAYSTALGPLIAGKVPIWVPVSWFSIAVPAYALSLQTFPDQNFRLRRIAYGAFLIALWDVVLDPAMSRLTGYWTWSESGLFFGMPLKNLAGWFSTGAALMIVIEIMGGAWWGKKLSSALMRKYYGLLMLLPGGMLLVAGEWAPPAVVGVLLLVALAARSFRRPANVAAAISREPSHTIDKDSARDYFWAHSRSFSFASMAFPARRRRLVGLVYAFCRITDDIVDEAESGPEDVHRRLESWLNEAKRAYMGDPGAGGWLQELMQTSRAKRVPFSIIEDLIRGVERDMSSPSFETVEQLKDYCYGVASTVGLWLCHLHDVRDEWMLERAAALGRAMQITNIVRDVGEDLDRGRMYLPAEVLKRHGLTAGDLEAAKERGPIPEAYRALIREMISIADEEYVRAWEAVPLLPRGFATPAAVAADVYRGIQARVEKNDFDNLTQRARTSLATKVMLATKAWFRLRWRQARSKFGRPVALGAVLILAAALPQVSKAMTPVAPETLAELRALYIEAGDRREAIDDAQALIDRLQPEVKAEPVVEAFGGAFEVVRAKYSFWPFSKLKHVRHGLPVLDRLVEDHPDDVEIRFLRLVSCYYLPGIMGRKGTVRADLSELCDLLPAARGEFPQPWFRRMVSFVLGSPDIEPSSRIELQALLGDLRSSDQVTEEATP